MQDNENSLIDNHLSSQDKDKKKRRSKNDQNGRNYSCKHCEKTYLSEIALNNHIKTKHAHLIEIPSRGRGRPRKNPNEHESRDLVQSQETKFATFFETSLRVRIEEEEDYNIITAAQDNFNSIYTRYKEKLFKDISSPSDYPLINAQSGNQVNVCLWKYLENCKDKTNRDYFDFLFKFVVLLREYLFLKKEDYSEKGITDSIPDEFNEFVSDFMDSNEYFGLELNELIEAIQHLGYWIWENHYTSSKLSLVNPN